ncbi:MAG: hypothetical protein ACRDJ4_03900 [Actinomycetota bacterium]
MPRGLSDAPPDAYAKQPASFTETLARLPDAELVAHAERVARYAARLAERARRSWDGSPLINELRRRGLNEPLPPERVVGLAFSLKTPLVEWTNKEILAVAREWSKRGRAR